MTKHEAYADLIKLASEMVRGVNMVPTAWEDHQWFKTTPRGEKHRILRVADQAEDQARRWGIRLKEIADAIRTPMACAIPRLPDCQHATPPSGGDVT